MKQIFDTIPKWLVKGAKNAGRIKKEIKEKGQPLVSDIKDAYEKGRQDEIRRMDLETIHPDGSSKSEEPEQMDMFDDLPDRLSQIFDEDQKA